MAHQDDNLLAALLALATLDVDLAAATGALATFTGLPHRCQAVADFRGVHYVDDSKATNPAAAARSVAPMYMAGRILTASSPSRTWMESAA